MGSMTCMAYGPCHHTAGECFGSLMGHGRSSVNLFSKFGHLNSGFHRFPKTGTIQ